MGENIIVTDHDGNKVEFPKEKIIKIGPNEISTERTRLTGASNPATVDDMLDDTPVKPTKGDELPHSE